VAILDPWHLLEQSERLVAQQPAGPPRQVDIRRAISSAYYAVFHAVLTAAADQFVGSTKRATRPYGLVYRTIDHSALRELCEEVQKTTPRAKYRAHAPAGGFAADIVAFATAALELQDKRLMADYDPMVRMRRSDAAAAIGTARTALQRFDQTDQGSREAFLSLLLFPPRR
jgi:hypothetical protein